MSSIFCFLAKRVIGVAGGSAVLLVLLAGNLGLAADKKIVFVAGRPSHGPAQHEHRAGCLLLKSCLDKASGISSVVYTNGWPQDDKAFDGADTIVLYMDGGGGHPALQDDRLKQLARRAIVTHEHS